MRLRNIALRVFDDRQAGRIARPLATGRPRARLTGAGGWKKLEPLRCSIPPFLPLPDFVLHGTPPMSRFTALLAFACLGLTSAAFAENWPQWRGPELNGISREKGLPTTWSENQGVL